MDWWGWFIIGGIFLAFELLSFAFFAFFFGVAAVIVGALAWAFPLLTLNQEWLLFALLSVVSLLTLRRRFVMTHPQVDSSGLIGNEATVVNDFADGEGAVELRGARWKARSEDGLHAGEKVRVVAADGIVVTVKRMKS